MPIRTITIHTCTQHVNHRFAFELQFEYFELRVAL